MDKKEEKKAEEVILVLEKGLSLFVNVITSAREGQDLISKLIEEVSIAEEGCRRPSSEEIWKRAYGAIRMYVSSTLKSDEDAFAILLELDQVLGGKQE